MQEIELTRELLKRLQMTQYEMLEELDRICRKKHINYSIDGGTLLGAARDGHIIPWDDDIDIVMLREDYEKFFAVCKTEMDAERFFLQEHRTDPECNIGYARIRRKNTVYARAGHEHMKYQGGIFIDIFILDGVPDSKLLRPLHRFWCFALRKFLWAKSGWRLHESAFWRGVYRIWAKIPFEWTFHRIDALARCGNKKQREIVRHLTHPYPDPKTCPYGVPYDLFTEYTEIELEGKRFMCVKDYDRYLTLLYGDYMQLPPEEKRKPHIHLTRLEFAES